MQPSCLERAARSPSVTELFPLQPQGSAYRRNSPGCVNVNASRKYSQSRSTAVCRALFSLLDLDLHIIIRWIMEGRFPAVVAFVAAYGLILQSYFAQSLKSPVPHAHVLA